MALSVTIARVDQTLYEGEVEAVTCPGEDGELTVMAGHAPLVTRLKQGAVTVRPTEGDRQSFAVIGGVLETSGSSAVIMVQ